VLTVLFLQHHGLICQLKGLISFEPSQQFAVVEQLDRFDVGMMMKPLLMLPCEQLKHTESKMRVSVVKHSVIRHIRISILRFVVYVLYIKGPKSKM
jgi:hypothetical protein